MFNLFWTPWICEATISTVNWSNWWGRVGALPRPFCWLFSSWASHSAYCRQLALFSQRHLWQCMVQGPQGAGKLQLFFFSQSMYVTNHPNLKVACGIFSDQISQALALALDCHATWTIGCSPGHCKTFNSTPDLYPLDVNSIPPLWHPKPSLDIAKHLLNGQNYSWLKPLLLRVSQAHSQSPYTHALVWGGIHEGLGFSPLHTSTYWVTTLDFIWRKIFVV